ncbi:hypothetical protein ACPPVO_23555 [Dactylosporangium sp. McL0621]|uniref:hypothetical protein n=1 Tax=Dactylosporangium sp. McL0621 TaxID=3415678 RepID=UPI003CFAEB53
MDSVSAAAWAATVIATVSAAYAGRQAKNAKASAQHAERQARAAEDELLLTHLRMRAQGDDTLASRLYVGRLAARRYLLAAVASLHIVLGREPFIQPSVDLLTAYEEYKRLAVELNVTAIVEDVWRELHEIDDDSKIRPIYGLISERMMLNLQVQAKANQLRIRINRVLNDPMAFEGPPSG